MSYMIFVVLGRKIGEELLLSYFEPDWNLRVMGIGFTSDTDKGANWVLRENSGKFGEPG